MKRLIGLLLLIGIVSIPGYVVADSNTSYSPDIRFVVGNETVPRLDEGYGIYGSEVLFDGLYPGYSATVPLTIVNGGDQPRTFDLGLRTSAQPNSGFEALPQEYFSWLSIEEQKVSLPPGSSYKVPITLSIPKDSTYSGRAEVRILVRDVTQTGNVQIAYESLWFLITAPKGSNVPLVVGISIAILAGVVCLVVLKRKKAGVKT